MKTNPTLRTLVSDTPKIAAVLLFSILAFTSCNKKESADADQTTEVAVDSSAMPAESADSTAMPADTTAMGNNNATSESDTYGDDVVSIQKALRVIKKANVKGEQPGNNEIVLGTTEKAKRKCVTVTFKDGATGKVCASQDAIGRIKSECQTTGDCDVKDAK